MRDQVGAPYVQGYLLHRPMPVADLLEVVRGEPARASEPAGRTGRDQVWPERLTRPLTRRQCGDRGAQRDFADGVWYGALSGPRSMGISSDMVVCHQAGLSNASSAASTCSR